VIPALPESLSGAEREQARAIIASALGDTVRLALWIACALSLASALVSALMLGAASGASPGS